MAYALITGASSGLGKQFAIQLAARKRNLVLVARNRQAMEELAHDLIGKYQVHVIVKSYDLARFDSPILLQQELDAEGIDIDILVNNAGYGDLSDFSQGDPNRLQGMIDLNISCLTQLCRLYLPRFLAANRGYLLNVASTASFQPGPGMAVYFATKAYVHSLSQALREECRGSKVHISALHPGPTSTGFGAAANAEMIGKLSHFGPNASQVVNAGLQALIRNQALVIPGLANKIGVIAAKFLPLPFVVWATAKLFRKSVRKN